MPDEGVSVSRRVEADKRPASERGIQDGQPGTQKERSPGSARTPQSRGRSRLRLLLFLLLLLLFPMLPLSFLLLLLQQLLPCIHLPLL